MAHSGHFKSEIHFHIRWIRSSDSSLDWKPFPTEEEAVKLAGQVNRPNENYIIEERDDNCERCEAFRSRLTEQKITASETGP
jgi:hypothetical protein